MRVSVVIPCYRQAHYLPTAVDSALAQTHLDVEVIVVDDGSDDDVAGVTAQYAPRVRFVRRQNGGLAAARNTGAAIATGDYLKFLDADDYLVPEQLEWQVAALAGRFDAVSITAVRAYQESDSTDYRDLPPPVRSLLPDFFNQPDTAVHAFLFPVKLFRTAGGFREELRIAEDWDFFCRLGKLRPAVVTDDRVGAYYRLRAGSMSGDRRAMVHGVARMLIDMHDEFRADPDCAWFGRELLGAEQRTYRRMLIGGHRDTKLEQELLARIAELRAVTSGATGNWKFDTLCRTCGYRLAERLYAKYARARKRLAGVRS
jgi:glycosyltransferase involved in cell wall biosynthesis